MAGRAATDAAFPDSANEGMSALCGRAWNIQKRLMAVIAETMEEDPEHKHGKGLHAFVAAPRDEPGGVLSWISAKADGQIVAHDGRTLLLHDAEDDVLRVVRRKDGRMTREVPAGADRFLQTTGPLVAFVGKSGVVGLSKRN